MTLGGAALIASTFVLSRRIDLRLAVLLVAVMVAVVVLGFERELASSGGGGAVVATAAVGPGPWIALAGAAPALAGLALPRKGSGTS